MILKRAIISNFRGVNGSREIHFKGFNCIVGQNDVGKSTILKALDTFLNEVSLNKADYNVESEESQIVIELFFDCQNKQYLLGEEIATTIEQEELVNVEQLLVLKKIWTVTETNVSKPKLYITRKKYEGSNDFLLKTEQQLIALCTAHKIHTSKGNGEDFNNVEKRDKLREYNKENNIEFTYDYDEIPSAGTTKIKSIGDAIKKILPDFQYFKADTSLSESDNTIQKYFKELAYRLIQNELNTSDIEINIKDQLEKVLQKVTDKINDVLKSTEKVEPKIDFDWSKLITTSFVSTSSGNSIPLSSRGDGFRRITMMAYFEYLAESQRQNIEHPIIFGFEEPETFLHPSAQISLFEKLFILMESGYQVIISTHSPTIVGSTHKKNIIHISKPENNYTINQVDIDYKELALDLGIKPDNTFTPLFSTSQLLFLVEGIDDVNAMNYLSTMYKQQGLIAKTFEELNVNVVPIGGCDSVKHWVNLELFTKLQKPFFIFLDSDKESQEQVSANESVLIGYGLQIGVDFKTSKKRALENYIHPTTLQRIVPNSVITYSDFDHAKDFCRKYPNDSIRGQLGGAKVADKHFCNQTFDELRKSWADENGDEFIELYQIIESKVLQV